MGSIPALSSKEIRMQQNTDETVKFEQVDVSTVQDSKLNSQIALARQFPRDIKRAVKNSIDIVTLDIQSASSCTYSVLNEGKAVTGCTVHLAKTIAQNWGNMYIEAKTTNIEQKYITGQAIAIDLENNLSYKVEVKRSIVNHKGRFSDDMVTVIGNAANSIAMRNAILSVIPRAVIDKVYNEAKKTITGDLHDIDKLQAKRKEVFENLNQLYQVTEQEILLAIGKSSIDYVSSDDIIVLIGVTTGIKDGDTTVETAFGRKTTTNILTKESTVVEPIVVTESEDFKNKKLKA